MVFASTPGRARYQLAQRALDPGQTLTLSQSPGIRPGHHNRIRALRQPRALRGERLAEQALDAIALNRPADFPRDRQPEPARAFLSPREYVKNELAACVRAPRPEDPVEISAP
jgi:hypothetical protein